MIPFTYMKSLIHLTVNLFSEVLWNKNQKRKNMRSRALVTRLNINWAKHDLINFGKDWLYRKADISTWILNSSKRFLSHFLKFFKNSSSIIRNIKCKFMYQYLLRNQESKTSDSMLNQGCFLRTNGQNTR